jgi:hypothetical protein
MEEIKENATRELHAIIEIAFLQWKKQFHQYRGLL